MPQETPETPENPDELVADTLEAFFNQFGPIDETKQIVLDIFFEMLLSDQSAEH